MVAFGIYRDVISSVFPKRGAELDLYLAMIGGLNLKYGKLFHQCHKSFACKAALSFLNSILAWTG